MGVSVVTLVVFVGKINPSLLLEFSLDFGPLMCSELRFPSDMGMSSSGKVLIMGMSMMAGTSKCPSCG